MAKSFLQMAEEAMAQAHAVDAAEALKELCENKSASLAEGLPTKSPWNDCVYDT